jgi:cytochrome c-type biogenesis protein CcmH/NrfG
MTLSEFFSFSGPVVTFIAALVVILAAFRTNTARVWKEEAEAQKARAERLESDLKEIKNRLTHIERDNARLITLLTSLDPTRLTALRMTSDPLED